MYCKYILSFLLFLIAYDKVRSIHFITKNVICNLLLYFVITLLIFWTLRLTEKMKIINDSNFCDNSQ
jgi:hypothetical protein